MSQLRAYIRHVELYGTDDVLEAARRDLEPAQVGELVLHMRRVDPSWKLTQAERQELGEALIEAGASDKRLREVLDVGQAAVRALRTA